MKKFRGLGLFAILLVIAIGLLMGSCSFRTTAVTLENSTIAQFQQNKNSYDNFWKKVKETAQVTDQYKEDFTKMFIASMDARYKNGMGQLFAMVKEANPNFSETMYTKLQTVIEAGRNEFSRDQNDLLNKQNLYRQHLQSNFAIFTLMFMDFPKVLHADQAPPRDTDGDGKLTALDYPIVLSAATNEAFRTGEAEEVDVFNKKAPPTPSAP